MPERTMLQSLLESPGKLELRRTPIPEPGPGELVVRVEIALTCGTDLKTYRRGHPLFPCPTAIGHEFSGIVARAGAGARFKEGDPVAVVPSAPCGKCPSCRRGVENLCDEIHGRTMAWGAFADYVRVPERVARQHVFARPSTLSPRDAAFLEPLSCVVNGVSRLDLVRADSAVVLGAGPIGLLFVALLKKKGVPRVIAVGKKKTRLDAARALGASETVDAEEIAERAAIVERVRSLTSGEGAAAVIECVGRAESWEDAVSMTRKGGEALFYGGCAAGTRVPIDARRVHYEALTLKGAFHFSPRDVREAFDLLRDGALPVGKLVSDELPLTQLHQAIERLEAGECLKLAIRPSPDPT
ncbi:zinc-binding dehydrogenase [bacterium]|nr:zinc-binding dehydrogenase [bacterium]